MSEFPSNWEKGGGDCWFSNEAQRGSSNCKFVQKARMCDRGKVCRASIGTSGGPYVPILCLGIEVKEREGCVVPASNSHLRPSYVYTLS